MPFNGSGTFERVRRWTNDALAGISIRADRHDSEDDNFAQGLSQCITNDGQTTVTNNLPMANYRHTNVGEATAINQYARYDQLQLGKAVWAVAGGTADAITASYTPSTTTPVDGQLYYVRAIAANATTTPTFSPDGNTAQVITKYGASPLVAGDIAGDGHDLILRYRLSDTKYELLNPYPSIDLEAINVSYDNTVSGMTAVDVQAAIDENHADINLRIKQIKTTFITVTGAGTYTPTDGTKFVKIRYQGAGGGGGARDTNNGSDGGNTTFNGVVANGGEGGRYGGDGTVTRGGNGGNSGTGTATRRIRGSGGFVSMGFASPGGNSALGFIAGNPMTPDSNPPQAGILGSGGCGAGSNLSSTYSGGGGGAGEYVELEINNPTGSYAYTIGVGGNGGTAGTFAGAKGGDGWIEVTEYISI